jgi:hypothetical protein
MGDRCAGHMVAWRRADGSQDEHTLQLMLSSPQQGLRDLETPWLLHALLHWLTLQASAAAVAVLHTPGDNVLACVNVPT